ncbi:MAG: flagellar assembly protein FliX [Alphaproteobacteria bacterium]|nr:flagellar assembly protein FliX [Alphaproteobacteria bacterium]MBP7758419.1 flagellar assembly protein FliX [Alphaproteobacteria bacterium]MBP7762414.1 flagellar assembly protein FliX [Alphaproteobacteria bacterium]MBP7905432.1 flagellar assembly protein FliX [Alphaproteobacteria bacterium]
MKVEGPKKSQSTSQSRKSSASGADSVDFSQYIKSGQEASSVSTARAITNVDSLLAVQAAEDPTERAARRRMQDRSDKIIDGLEKIRLAMLNGTLTVGHMIDIADIVASHREKIQDPKLTDIMDEIDLRAQVELAKMRVAMGA